MDEESLNSVVTKRMEYSQEEKKIAKRWIQEFMRGKGVFLYKCDEAPLRIEQWATSEKGKKEIAKMDREAFEKKTQMMAWRMETEEMTKARAEVVEKFRLLLGRNRFILEGNMFVKGDVGGVMAYLMEQGKQGLTLINRQNEVREELSRVLINLKAPNNLSDFLHFCDRMEKVMMKSITFRRAIPSPRKRFGSTPERR